MVRAGVCDSETLASACTPTRGLANFDSHPSFTRRLREILVKARRKLGSVAHAAHIMPPRALILPRLEFCSPEWSSHQESLQQALKGVQHRGAHTLYRQLPQIIHSVLIVPFNFRFLYVEIGHHGSESDGGIFARSQLQQRINCGEQGLPPPAAVGEEGDLPYFLLGDEAFPLKPYLMRPYPRKSK